MKVIFNKVEDMVWVYISVMIIHMMVNGLMVKWKVMVNYHGLMVEHIKVNL